MGIISQYNYLAYHSIIEIVSIIIAFTIFIIGWNSRHLTSDNRFLLLAVGYMLVGVLDILHMLTYQGMNIFPELSANIPTQFWIAGRFVESIAFFLYAFFNIKGKEISSGLIFGGYFLSGLALISTILWLKVFPVCYVEETGLTSFKIFSEYLISFVLAITAFLFWNYRKLLGRPRICYLIIASIISTILSEISFTLYNNPYGFFNILGHLFKLISFTLIYRALVEEVLKRPYHALFQKYNQSQERLNASGSLLSTMFHDLKNPLSTIRALSQLGSNNLKPEKQKEYFLKIIDKVDQLSEMLNKVLGTFKPQRPEKADPIVLIEEVMEDLEPVCQLKDIGISLLSHCQLEMVLEGGLFKRAIHNLLRNSVQVLGKNGKVEVEVWKRGSRLFISVKDNGPGIPDGIQENIFKPFINGAKGTGLGLYMVYYTVTKVHNGKIRFETRPEKGTTFYIQLPIISDDIIYLENDKQKKGRNGPGYGSPKGI